jgi:hypothetical protein
MTAAFREFLTRFWSRLSDQASFANAPVIGDADEIVSHQTRAVRNTATTFYSPVQYHRSSTGFFRLILLVFIAHDTHVAYIALPAFTLELSGISEKSARDGKGN